MHLQTVHKLSILILLFGLVSSGVGLFYNAGTGPLDVMNQYGQTVALYGKGLYAHDSLFKAPIFRGTDFIVFFLLCPLLCLALVQDIKKKCFKSKLTLASLIFVFVYYAASICFGVTYNSLQLVYIALFATSFFGFINAMMRIPLTGTKIVEKKNLPYRGIYVFLVLTGLALVIAWLPEIVGSLVENRPLAMIETYTTEITFVLDMGIIAPLCFICIPLLKKRSLLGFILLELLLTLCMAVGLMLPVQTIFQLKAGIILPVGVLITKMFVFCALAAFAAYYYRRVKRDTELQYDANNRQAIFSQTSIQN
jgi:hypothetical protein